MTSQKTSVKIIAYIQQHRQASGKELADALSLSDRAIRKQLKQLLDRGELSKTGKPPKVYYQLAEAVVPAEPVHLEKGLVKVIDKEFLFISPTGEKTDGMAGFRLWCQARKLPLEKTAREYVQTRKKYESLRVHGLIDASEKMRQTFPQDQAINALYYADVYSIERFGKTRLGQLLLYAKQSQDRRLIKEVVDIIRPLLKELIERENIDAVGYIPPTVKRSVQFMKELQRQLALPLHAYNIVKLKTPVIVPQKTLSKLSERVENARRSIVVDDSYRADNVLLIDDAAGSGATLHETATQLRSKNLVAEKILAFAVSGSVKGFEVIQEV